MVSEVELGNFLTYLTCVSSSENDGVDVAAKPLLVFWLKVGLVLYKMNLTKRMLDYLEHSVPRLPN